MWFRILLGLGQVVYVWSCRCKCTTDADGGGKKTSVTEVPYLQSEKGSEFPDLHRLVTRVIRFRPLLRRWYPRTSRVPSDTHKNILFPRPLQWSFAVYFRKSKPLSRSVNPSLYAKTRFYSIHSFRCFHSIFFSLFYESRLLIIGRLYLFIGEEKGRRMEKGPFGTLKGVFVPLNKVNRSIEKVHDSEVKKDSPFLSYSYHH